MVAVAGLAGDRHGVAHHRAQVRHEVPRLLQIKRIGGGIVPGDLFPAVVNGRGVPSLQFEEGAVRQRDEVRSCGNTLGWGGRS